MQSLFPIGDVAVMGIGVDRSPPAAHRAARLPDGRSGPRRARPTSSSSSTARTSPMRSRSGSRAAVPDLPIVDYVSPSVWAWRPGRAPRMTRYVDHVLALLPFEPEAHARLGGPPCTYVGHPLIERLDELRPLPASARRSASDPVLLVLPGSRRTEISRLMPPFGEAVRQIAEARPGLEILLPAVPHLAEGDRGRACAMAGAAADRPGRSREVRGVPARACGARRVRHGDAGTRPCRRADGRRLPGRSARPAAQAVPQGAFDRARQSRPRRERDPGIPRRRRNSPEVLAREVLALLSDGAGAGRAAQRARPHRLGSMALPEGDAAKRQGGRDRDRSGGERCAAGAQRRFSGGRRSARSGARVAPV